MTKIVVGDVVRLKSGGPEMTVVQGVPPAYVPPAPDDNPRVQCYWFEGPNLYQGYFDPRGMDKIR